MTVAIRLRKINDKSKKRYNFRIAAVEKTRSRDDRVIEELGYYDPAKNPAALKVNKERIEFWVKSGAQLSPTVKSLVKKIK
ncbi:MAG TPA: 30S ribosomal protein S16 [Candidatus Omnitrophica bacterium]|nr:30S ribosomal protein S16 [Candidatus Omnitrophota bacterium]